ncbi:MAG: hypothetical protein VB861_04165, partial [Planctomycetaceae bacterium]
GPKCGRNPWNANGLEWSAPSPPPHGNFETVPIVYRGPYEYSSPLVEGRDFLMQTEYLPPPEPDPESAAEAPATPENDT